MSFRTLFISILNATILFGTVSQAEKHEELKSVRLLVEDFERYHGNPEFQALVLTQCGAILSAMSRVTHDNDERIKFDELSQNFISAAIWAKTGFKEVPPSNNSMNYLTAWISDRYLAFGDYYFLKLNKERAVSGTFVTEEVASELETCGNFYGDIKP